jgi:hypothetical protein
MHVIWCFTKPCSPIFSLQIIYKISVAIVKLIAMYVVMLDDTLSDLYNIKTTLIWRTIILTQSFNSTSKNELDTYKVYHSL